MLDLIETIDQLAITWQTVSAGVGMCCGERMVMS